MLPVTSLYAALLALMLVVLANIVSAQRSRAKVPIFHGDDMTLAVWMRRHGNFIENVPLALILLGLAETRGLDASWLHAAGIVLIVARIAHVAGLNAERLMSPLRLAGGIGTQAMMLGLAGYLIWSLA